MELSSDLVSQFAKLTKDTTKTKSETVLFGTVVEKDEILYVQLDGSDMLTPMLSVVEVKAGERVTVMLKNHSATVTGNISSPAVRTGTVEEIISGIPNTDNLSSIRSEIASLKETDAQITETLNTYDRKILSIQTSVNEFTNKVTALINANNACKTLAGISETETTLRAVIYLGVQNISNIGDFRTAFGAEASIQWTWERASDNSIGRLESTDARIGEDGFTITPLDSDIESGMIFRYDIVV